MKLKLYFSIVAFLFFAATPAFASFPVTTANNAEIVDTIENVEEGAFVSPAANSGKSQIVATLLCWLVGIIGIHRFYLGYTWQGVVQILTLGGLGIWTLIDLIRIIIGDLQPKGGSYDKTF